MGDEAASRAPRESRCEVAGWRFEACHGDAMSSDARAELAHERLQLNGRVPLPEMVFAQNRLTIRHPSHAVCLQFEVEPALKLWAASHKGDHWDQTNFDFTYCTNYQGSVERVAPESDADGEQVAVVPTTERLPLDKLMQHVEILFYDHVVLLEDDVRDLGEIYLEAKTRVMAFGFLVLCRYYCRVDGKSVRLVDTRYYHEFGQEFIWRDHEVREAPIDELRQLVRTVEHDGHSVALPPDYSADAVYSLLQPSTATVTEKIYF